MISASKCRPLNSEGCSRLIQAEAYQAAGTPMHTAVASLLEELLSLGERWARENQLYSHASPIGFSINRLGLSSLGHPAMAIGMAEVRAKPIQQSCPIS